MWITWLSTSAFAQGLRRNDGVAEGGMGRLETGTSDRLFLCFDLATVVPPPERFQLIGGLGFWSNLPLLDRRLPVIASVFLPLQIRR